MREAFSNSSTAHGRMGLARAYSQKAVMQVHERCSLGGSTAGLLSRSQTRFMCALRNGEVSTTRVSLLSIVWASRLMRSLNRSSLTHSSSMPSPPGSSAA